ncbi:MAG: MBL fold metallo-hydrolase [Myxococcales bacterium]|nr:MBL fold metallo-hydrolase [Myxococcales bacterium]
MALVCGLASAPSCAPERPTTTPQEPSEAEAAAAAPERPADATPRTQPITSWYFGANEGVLLNVRSGDAPAIAILIDAVVGDGLPGYEAPSPAERATLLKTYGAASDLAAVYVLATHHHGDHFDPRLTLRLLQGNPRAQVITTPQAVAAMRSVDAAAFAAIEGRARAVLPPEGSPREIALSPDVRLRILNLHHGRERRPPIEHLGFLLEVGADAFLHLGDAELSLDELAALDLGAAAPKLEAIFVPYWHLLDEAWTRTLLRDTHRPSLAALHVPTADAPAPYFEPYASQEGLVAGLRERVHVPEDSLLIPVAGSQERAYVYMTIEPSGSNCEGVAEPSMPAEASD